MWGVGSRLPVNGYEKAWNLTFTYSLNGGSCKTLQTRTSKKRFLYYVRKPINRITSAKVVIFCEISKKKV